MPGFIRSFILACVFLGLTLGLVTTVAAARTVRHHHHIAKTQHHASRSNSQLRSAQAHLAHLGYYTGKADGISGPKAKIALKNFQRDHRLPVTGTLTKKTYTAILEADRKLPHGMGGGGHFDDTVSFPPPAPAENYYATHPDFYGHYDQQHDNPLMLSNPQSVPTRYGKLELTKGDQNNYNLTLNGQPVLAAQNQASVIGLSSTFALGDEDAVVVSTYRNASDICPYKNYLLSLKNGADKVTEIPNCTRGYQATMKDGSLWIVFPEADDNRDVGATFRYESGDLEKL
ncbi:MAG TPA: peptidoglycan-binding domain-containing protein [Alphaproteobacteria bacterium]|nr:peptidoglycan-binding domain-containing protein [Alphaproteobacteria bacterium]